MNRPLLPSVCRRRGRVNQEDAFKAPLHLKVLHWETEESLTGGSLHVCEVNDASLGSVCINVI